MIPLPHHGLRPIQFCVWTFLDSYDSLYCYLLSLGSSPTTHSLALERPRTAVEPPWPKPKLLAPVLLMAMTWSLFSTPLEQLHLFSHTVSRISWWLPAASISQLGRKHCVGSRASTQLPWLTVTEDAVGWGYHRGGHSYRDPSRSSSDPREDGSISPEPSKASRALASLPCVWEMLCRGRLRQKVSHPDSTHWSLQLLSCSAIHFLHPANLGFPLSEPGTVPALRPGRDTGSLLLRAYIRMERGRQCKANKNMHMVFYMK